MMIGYTSERADGKVRMKGYRIILAVQCTEQCVGLGEILISWPWDSDSNFTRKKNMKKNQDWEGLNIHSVIEIRNSPVYGQPSPA